MAEAIEEEKGKRAKVDQERLIASAAQENHLSDSEARIYGRLEL